MLIALRSDWSHLASIEFARDAQGDDSSVEARKQRNVRNEYQG